jgi:hypothetical protein
MNTLKILSIATRVASLLGNQWPKGLPKGDAGLYVLARSLAEKLERSNPGMAESLSYDPITSPAPSAIGANLGL